MRQSVPKSRHGVCGATYFLRHEAEPMQAWLRVLKRFLGAGFCPLRRRPVMTAIVMAAGLLLPSSPLLREVELSESPESAETECCHLRLAEGAGSTEIASRRRPSQRSIVVDAGDVLNRATVSLLAEARQASAATPQGHRLANGLTAPLRL